MIVRVSEALVKPERREEFMRVLKDLVATFPDRYPGLVSHSILVDREDDTRVAYQSVWLDEDSVAGFAGENWATEPVTFPGEAELLQQPLRLRHFDTAEPDDSAEDFEPEE
ncbi:MAG TPA: antibiotic biosynthesis monooxygenase [Pseudolysinimonas sp.]|nr:antibiotic biosynthesis monooxygenase [Pseudolysinimonas sp.]